ncbi:single-stranded DNA-binding protein [Mycoplasmatota bacterium]|nr:single-stranded DNA-binding protein [Mycoplasmatota bacterium]
MLNQCILVGRLVGNPISETIESGVNKIKITLDIKRSFKNPNTLEYDSDLVTISLWEGVEGAALDFLKEGSVVGIKARIQQASIETKNGTIHIPEIVGEKITYINSRKEFD